MPCTRLAAIAALVVASMPVAWADSLASSASSAGSASIGSLSDSVGRSSNSSASDKKVADGDYRVVEITASADRPGLLRLTLEAAADKALSFTLTLPEKVLAARPLAVGDVVRARQRDYGVAFARANGEAFFVALADDWRGELDARAVAL